MHFTKKIIRNLCSYQFISAHPAGRGKAADVRQSIMKSVQLGFSSLNVQKKNLFFFFFLKGINSLIRLNYAHLIYWKKT